MKLALTQPQPKSASAATGQEQACQDRQKQSQHRQLRGPPVTVLPAMGACTSGTLHLYCL